MTFCGVTALAASSDAHHSSGNSDGAGGGCDANPEVCFKRSAMQTVVFKFEGSVLCCIILTELDVVVMLCGAFNVPWINKPAHISANGRMISHFELYFDLVLVRLHEPPSPLA